MSYSQSDTTMQPSEQCVRHRHPDHPGTFPASFVHKSLQPHHRQLHTYTQKPDPLKDKTPSLLPKISPLIILKHMSPVEPTDKRYSRPYSLIRTFVPKPLCQELEIHQLKPLVTMKRCLMFCRERGSNHRLYMCEDRGFPGCASGH